MLKACLKGDYMTVIVLSERQDRLLRRGFGRFATPEARAEAALVVQDFQLRGPGYWFRCDCLDYQEERPPVLIPVLESFIRRHTESPWPAHAETCDFFREPAEQRAITKSYGPPAPGPLRLVRRYAQADGESPIREAYRSYAWRREGLATMMRQLQIQSGLNRVANSSSRPKLGDQYRLLRGAAGQFELDDNLPLSRYFCTYPPALSEFMEKVAGAPARQFKNTRPHGIFLSVINGVGNGQLLVSDDLTLPVRGRISIFGEQDGHRRETAAEQSARTPYLAACLVARPKPADPVCILKAYLHPCINQRDLLLVDSNFERSTFAELRRLQRFLSSRLNIQMEIEKPMLDINAGEDPENLCVAAREPCIPDFILHTYPPSPGSPPTLIVETMGFAGATYRARKAITHIVMARTMKAPILVHDFHFPEIETQIGRDRLFWSSARWLITGKRDNRRLRPRTEAFRDDA